MQSSFCVLHLLLSAFVPNLPKLPASHENLRRSYLNQISIVLIFNKIRRKHFTALCTAAQLFVHKQVSDVGCVKW